MKGKITALVAGLVLGATGVAAATTGIDIYSRNGVHCTPTGHGSSAGIVCWLDRSHRLAIVNHNRIIVGADSGVLYATSSR